MSKRKPYRPSRVDRQDEVGIIHLNNGGSAFIDAADIAIAANRAWRQHANGSGNVYASCRIENRTVFLHRLLMQPEGKAVVDHVDGDGLNCRRSNMRLASPSENQRNRRSRKTGFKGVHKQHERDLWYASITVNGKVSKLGYFKTPEEAARRYDAEALKLHGKFACINFPSPFSSGRAF